MSSLEWSRYMHDVVGLPEPPEEISAKVVRRLEEIYRRELPLIDGAVDAVERLAALLPRDGLLGGSSAREAGARRLPRGDAAPRSRARSLRRHRGLRERHPKRQGWGDASARDPEPAVSAGRRGPCSRRRGAQIDRRIDARGNRTSRLATGEALDLCDRRLGVAEIEVPEGVERAADVEVFHVRPRVGERLRQAAKGLSQAVPQSNEVVRELKAFQAFAAFWSSVSNPFSLGLTSVSESISVRALTRSSRSRSVSMIARTQRPQRRIPTQISSKRGPS